MVPVLLDRAEGEYDRVATGLDLVLDLRPRALLERQRPHHASLYIERCLDGCAKQWVRGRLGAASRRLQRDQHLVGPVEPVRDPRGTGTVAVHLEQRRRLEATLAREPHLVYPIPLLRQAGPPKGSPVP